MNQCREHEHRIRMIEDRTKLMEDELAAIKQKDMRSTQEQPETGVDQQERPGPLEYSQHNGPKYKKRKPILMRTPQIGKKPSTRPSFQQDGSPTNRLDGC